MRTQLPAALLATAVACALSAAPANAQVPRTFVSAAGSDSNNCANIATPCRHFAAAFAATAPSGEIFALDPANYGSLTITHAVSIEGHGWASIAPPNNGNAVTINAASGDSISIHGVAIDGTGATGNTNGIVFNSGASLTVTNCTVQNFAGEAPAGTGILIEPISGGSFVIADTSSSNNGYAGIYMNPTGNNLHVVITNTTLANDDFGFIYKPPSGSPTSNIVLDHVVVTNSHNFGLEFEPLGNLDVAIKNSTTSSNSYGIIAHEGIGTISVDNTTINGNSVGIYGGSPVTVLLSRSVIQGNSTGIDNQTSNTFYTYGNNLIDFNTTNITNPLNTLTQLR